MKNMQNLLFFRTKFMFFYVQNRYFHRSPYVDAVKKCTRNIHFLFKTHYFLYKNHSFFFLQRSATKSVRKSKKELQRSSGLRGAGKRWLGSANPYTGFTRRLHRTVCFARLLRTSRKTGRTYTAARNKRKGLRRGATAGKGPRRGAASVQRDGNAAAAAWRWRGA